MSRQVSYILLVRDENRENLLKLQEQNPANSVLFPLFENDLNKVLLVLDELAGKVDKGVSISRALRRPRPRYSKRAARFFEEIVKPIAASRFVSVEDLMKKVFDVYGTIWSYASLRNQMRVLEVMGLVISMIRGRKIYWKVVEKTDRQPSQIVEEAFYG